MRPYGALIPQPLYVVPGLVRFISRECAAERSPDLLLLRPEAVPGIVCTLSPQYRWRPTTASVLSGQVVTPFPMWTIIMGSSPSPATAQDLQPDPRQRPDWPFPSRSSSCPTASDVVSQSSSSPTNAGSSPRLRMS